MQGPCSISVGYWQSKQAVAVISANTGRRFVFRGEVPGDRFVWRSQAGSASNGVVFDVLVPLLPDWVHLVINSHLELYNLEGTDHDTW